MCELHHAALKSLQAVRGAPEALSAMPRQQFCLGNACERNTKPLVLLPRASLAAFNRGLNAVAS